MNSPESVQSTIDHLFRHEYGKLVPILTRTFGIGNLELAEDVVQDTLLKAMEQWKLKGIPDNPTAWLLTVARNKALDSLRRNRYKAEYTEAIAPLLRSGYTDALQLDKLLGTQKIEDGQLRMMFVCCHPSLPEESQVALILKTLCGFSIKEIASAFLTLEETITKRLYRARERFRELRTAFDLPEGEELIARRAGVHTAIYLLFNEGYHSSHSDQLIREDLIEEALRLAHMIHLNPETNSPETEALLALMCFHSARLAGRTDEHGIPLQLKYQDRKKWNFALIQQGIHFLNLASNGNQLTKFHLEARLAYEYTIPSDFKQTNWLKIDHLYKLLALVDPGDMTKFHHTIVKMEQFGPEVGLFELDKIKSDFLLAKPSYFLARAFCYLQLAQTEEAKLDFQKAYELSASEIERVYIENQLNKIIKNKASE